MTSPVFMSAAKTWSCVLLFLMTCHLAASQHCYGIRLPTMNHSSDDQEQMCCFKRRVITQHVQHSLGIQGAPRLGTRWDLLHYWKAGKSRRITLDDPPCLVTVQNKGWGVFVIDTAHCCSGNGENNRCCELIPQDFILEDGQGLPICGRFVRASVLRDVGIGHTMAEYNSNVALAYLLGLWQIRGNVDHIGHRQNLHDFDVIFGDKTPSPDGRWDVDQVRRAVDKGYLRNVSFDNGMDLIQKVAELKSTNVVFWTGNQVNSGNGFDYTAFFYQRHILHQQMLGALSTLSPYEPGEVSIAVHIRRGDIKEYDKTRFVPLSYYINVTSRLSKLLDSDVTRLYLVSEGKPNMFKEFTDAYPNSTLILNGNGALTMYHYLFHADILVTAPSGFSLLAAELGHAMVVAIPFWHKYRASAHRLVLTDRKKAMFNATEFVEKFCSMRHCHPCRQVWDHVEFHW